MGGKTAVDELPGRGTELGGSTVMGALDTGREVEITVPEVGTGVEGTTEVDGVKSLALKCH